MPVSAQTIRSRLSALSQRRSVDAALDLFDALGYAYADELPLPTRNWPDGVQQLVRKDAEPPLYLARHRDFYVVYTHLTADHLSRTVERPIVEQTLHKLNPYALFLFANRDLTRWDFVNVKYAVEEDEDGVPRRRRTIRRIHVGPGERLHTAVQRIAMLTVPGPQVSALELQNLHDRAFDVQEVTKKFYEDYKGVFGKLCDDIAKRNPKRAPEAETEAQLLLDRLMFLYFIQKKGWLNGQTDYLYRRFVARHRAKPTGTDFYGDVLLPLFMALSNQSIDLPGLGEIPFLNGGLFEVATDAPLAEQIAVGNDVLDRVFGNLLERYNFTVREDTPLDVEVAIDPEMLGQVFENLVLGLERGEDRRKATGSYYTPRVIVHFMCRQALGAYLAAESGIAQERIETWMDVGPAEQLTPEEVAGLKGMIGEPQARLLRGLIQGARMLDPAVGSGAFVVGMLYEMVALTKLLDVRLHGQARVRRHNYDYDLKRRFIERCLYGVDIQPEAVRICELRLWLSLMVDYERRPGEAVPPLPNLSYRVRVGDSLIERLFGEPVQLDALPEGSVAHQLVDHIRAEKGAYFQESGLWEKQRRELRILELLCELTTHLIGAKRGTLLLRRSAEVPAMFADREELLTKKQLKAKREVDAELTRYETLIKRVKEVYDQVHAIQSGEASFGAHNVDALRERLGISFIWRLDYAEVFAEKGGFDMVVANPPYGFHQIHPESVKPHLKRHYLASQGSFEHYFLFYERSVKLLKSNGVNVFIAPVTWLTIPSARSLRKLILEGYRVSEICWLSELVFSDAKVNTLVSIIQNSPPSHTMVKVYDRLDFHTPPKEKRTYDQSRFIDNDYYMGIFETKSDTEIIRKMESLSQPIGEIARPCSGYNPYEVGKGQTPSGGPHTKETVKTKPYHSSTKLSDEWKPEVGGRNLGRYSLEFGGDRWVKYGSWLAAPRNPENFRGRRILVQEITGGQDKRIVATYCDSELYHSRDVIPIKIERKHPHPLYILGQQFP